MQPNRTRQRLIARHLPSLALPDRQDTFSLSLFLNEKNGINRKMSVEAGSDGFQINRLRIPNLLQLKIWLKVSSITTRVNLKK